MKKLPRDSPGIRPLCVWGVGVPPGTRCPGHVQHPCATCALSSQVGAEYAVSLAEQERQVEALKVLEHGLGCVAKDRGADLFEGLTVQVRAGAGAGG